MSGCNWAFTQHCGLCMGCTARWRQPLKSRAPSATQTWAEGVWVGIWCTEQNEAWMKEIFEIQTWKQVSGPAGAVICETRGLGMKWPQCHPVTFEGQVQVDMRYVFPRDMKNMLLRQARGTFWRKWPAKHDFKKLKEGIWLEPALALLRRKTKEE